jgi:hypothetical protein
MICIYYVMIILINGPHENLGPTLWLSARDVPPPRFVME